jgi:hypothetical protein
LPKSKNRKTGKRQRTRKNSVGKASIVNSLRPKKIPVVPVSYREKIRVGRSEIHLFFEYFFHGFGGFLLGDLQ